MNTFNKAINWVKSNSVENNGGIIVSAKQRELYPEVTGYFIPSLIYANEMELAKSYARHLCAIQHDDGAWYDSKGENPFIFDGGQILKGLVAIVDIMPEVKPNLIKGIDWILSNMNDEGRLVQPNETIWGGDDSHCNDLIHIYTLSPIIEAAEKFNIPEYKTKVNKILDYYIDNNYERIINYTLFSHFYAYVIEGLIDCGRIEVAKTAMRNFEKYRKANGGVCAYNNVKWECSTAMFQFAIIWYKLGEKRKADLTFDHTCKLQNKSGGWYGCYCDNFVQYLKGRLQRNLYYRDSEISWAVKFYLDAKKFKEMSEKDGK